MEKKSMIIIGAGLAGLSTGCYAQMNGYESKIFEHHSVPGGVAAVWKRGDYLIDGGIHFLIGHRPGNSIYDVYSEICDIQSIELEDMTTYLRFVDKTGKKSIEFTQDIEKLERDLLQLAPEDENEIRNFVKEVRSLKDSPLLSDMGMSTAPLELRGRLDSLKEMWQMRGFMKYFIGKYSKSAAEYAEHFQNPFLKTVFTWLFSPDGPIWFVIMILVMAASGLLGLFKGGCHTFVRAIEKRYKLLGGQIQYRAKVDKIIVEDDTAVGVLLADGSEYRADVVVSAADGRSTIFNLLEGNYIDDKIKKRYDTWKTYDPMIAVSLGISRTFEDEAPLNAFMQKEPIHLSDREVPLLFLRVFNHGDVFAPEGKSVIQIILETEWDYWNDLQKDRAQYEKAKENLAQDLIDRLDKIFPGIRSQVEMIDVTTPYTTWRYTLNDRGSPMGWLMTKSTLMEQIPRTLPGLDNFYMAGHWVLPGGGVPSSIYTGRNVIQILCKNEGKEFKTRTTPST